MDAHLMQTPHIIMDSLLCPLGKESPYIFSKFNLLITDTLLIKTLSMAPLVSLLTGFDSVKKQPHKFRSLLPVSVVILHTAVKHFDWPALLIIVIFWKAVQNQNANKITK